MSGPERIWATGDKRNGSWTHAELPEKWNAAQTEYIRADLFSAAIKALVEAWRSVDVELSGAVACSMAMRDPKLIAALSAMRAAIQMAPTPVDGSNEVTK